MTESEKHEILQEIETLRAEKEALEREKSGLLFERKLESALAKENVRQVQMVRALLDAEKLELDENDQFVNLSEQLAHIRREAPSLFRREKDAVFTGSAGNFTRSPAAAENPWSKDSFNLTKQGEIFRKDPAKARRMMGLAKKH